jgi:hypothetical protein
MPKTANEVVSQAHRYLGVLSVDETVSPDQETFGGAVLDGLLAEAQTAHGLTFAWTSAEVPDGVWLPLSRLLAAEIAGHYERPAEPVSRAWMRFRAAVNADDRTDWRDLDEDGIVQEDEADVADRAAYY